MSEALLNKDDFGPLEVISYFEFLDELRDSGETNMFGAAPYLTQNFHTLDIREARTVLYAWGKTFDSEVDAEERAYKALGDDAN